MPAIMTRITSIIDDWNVNGLCGAPAALHAPEMPAVGRCKNEIPSRNGAARAPSPQKPGHWVPRGVAAAAGSQPRAVQQS